MILKAYKYRLSPTIAQSILLDKHIGSVRFVYNLALEVKQTAYAGKQVNLSQFDLIKQLPELKKECEWLKEINSQSLQQSIVNLDTAYTNFFKGRADFPKYKSKHKGTKSFNIPQSVKLENGKLKIPKFIKGITVVQHREFNGSIKQCTISRTPTGKYYASVLVETTSCIVPAPPIKKENTVGIDLGIKDFLITSDGQKIENPKYLRKAISKLKYVQSKYSRKKGKRTKYKLGILHEKVVNKRTDFLHQISTKLIRENQTIALETLQVKNMIKNHCLAQAISDVSWGTFVTMLEYKAQWYGTNIIRIGKFEPSSKTCSVCGSINKELKLSHREWTCENGHELDRDINAAINIKNFALRNHLTGEHSLKNRNELPTLVGVLTYEATTPSG
jgi:putative transposase